jgi:hypothetical protein
MLYKNSVIPNNIFSLCFAPDGGYFSVGGLNRTLHTEEEVKYIDYYDTNFYKVKLKDVIVNSVDFSVNENEYFTIIDSGTTLSYFPKKLYTEFEKQINVVCSEINRCLGDSFTAEVGICYKLKENVSVLQFVESMPTFSFIFENNTTYYWKPQNYLFNYTDSASNDNRMTLCIGLTGWNSNEILLGSTWMHNHDIIFDLQNKKIGLIESNCAGENFVKINPQTPSIINNSVPLIPSSADSCDAKVDMYTKVIIIISALGAIIIILLALGLHRLRNGQNFLWVRLNREESSTTDKAISNQQIDMGKVIEQIESESNI